MSAKPALYGGAPVRTKPLGSIYYGAYVMGKEERDAVAAVIDSQSPFRYYGPNMLYKVREFEKAFETYTDVPYALGVTSGTAALIVALRALGVGPGDEVIVPGWTFIASPLAVIAAGAVPVFAEADESFTLDPDRIEERVTPRTKAIMPVHLAGTSCDMGRIMEVAHRLGLPVVEDCAQAGGARWRGRAVGSIGAINAFSLQLNKMITTGEGGVVTTADPLLMERAVRCHDQGIYNSDFQGNVRDARVEARGEDFCGENYRMSELTGAVALEQLKKLPGMIVHMRSMWARLFDGVKDLESIGFRMLPDPEGDTGSAFALLFGEREARDRFLKLIVAEGIAFRAQYNSTPVYMTPRVREKRSWHPLASPWHPSNYDGDISYGPGTCPRTEDLLARQAIVNINPLWKTADVDDVISAMHKVWPYVIQPERAEREGA